MPHLTEAISHKLLVLTDMANMPILCSGCEWLQATIEEHQRLANEFSELGEGRLAQISRECADSLLADWHAHLRCDHPDNTEAIRVLNDLVAISAKVGRSDAAGIVHVEEAAHRSSDGLL